MAADFRIELEDYIKKMPSLPMLAGKVLEVCNNQHTSPDDLKRIISLDPVLLGRVIKLANSVHCGQLHGITNLSHIIIKLGVNTVKNLVLSAAMAENLPPKEQGLDKEQGLNLEDFWRHSFCVGISAKLLAKRRGIDSELAEKYFAAGLLHDIGKIPLNGMLPSEYILTIDRTLAKKASLHKTEGEILGLSHCETGAMISSAWKLEKALADAIIFHHDFGSYCGDHKDIVYTVAAANSFAVSSGMGFSGEAYPEIITAKIWDALNISRKAFDEINENVQNEIKKAEVFLRISRH